MARYYIVLLLLSGCGLVAEVQQQNAAQYQQAVVAEAATASPPPQHHVAQRPVDNDTIVAVTAVRESAASHDAAEEAFAFAAVGVHYIALRSLSAASAAASAAAALAAVAAPPPIAAMAVVPPSPPPSPGARQVWVEFVDLRPPRGSFSEHREQIDGSVCFARTVAEVRLQLRRGGPTTPGLICRSWHEEGSGSMTIPSTHRVMAVAAGSTNHGEGLAWYYHTEACRPTPPSRVEVTSEHAVVNYQPTVRLMGEGDHC